MLHPSGLWREIGEKLLADLVVNEGTGWLQRQEAASRLLLEHPAAGPHLIEACVDLVEDPHRPAVIEPLSLLDVTADPVANAYVLKQLESPDSDRHHQGALLAAVRKIENGHFRGDQWERLSLLLGQTGASGEAARLLGAATRAYTREAEETVTAEGRRVAAEATARLGSAGEPDPARALQTMTMLGTGVHRPLLLDLLTGPGHDLAVRRAAAWAMPHCGGSFTERQWRLVLARQGDGHVRHGVTYGIGTDGHRRLLDEIAGDPAMPGIVRATARWLKPHR